MKYFVFFIVLAFSFFTISCKSKLQKKDKSLSEMQGDDDGIYQPVIPGADVRVYKQIDTTKMRVNIFYPPDYKKTNKTPCIVFFFGGAFLRGSPTQYTEHCKYFASRGIVAITADYRVITRNNTTAIESVLDAKSCIRWIRENADSLGIDPNKIIMSGGSAGGLLCIAAAMDQKDVEDAGDNKNISSVPNAMVLFNPVVNLEEFDFRIRKFPGKAQSMNPITHVQPQMPPAIIFHGTADKMSAYKFVEQYVADMQKAGNEVELHTYKGQQHGFAQPNQNDGKYYRETLQLADDWLVKKGFLKPAGYNN